jgi:hypothetical protein
MNRRIVTYSGRQKMKRSGGRLLLLLAAGSFVWYVVDYQSDRSAGPARVMSAILLVAGVTVGLLLFVGQKFTLKVWGGIAAGGLAAVTGLVGLPNGSEQSTKTNTTPPVTSLPIPSSPAPLYCKPKLADEATIQPGDDAGASDIKVLNASYQVNYTGNQDMSVMLASKLSRPPDQGNVLYLAGWSDPAPTDSSEPGKVGKPGSGTYFLLRRADPDNDGCVRYTATYLYNAYCGITTRFYFVLMSENVAQTFEHRKQASKTTRDNGFDRGELDSGAYLLQYFDVPSHTC